MTISLELGPEVGRGASGAVHVARTCDQRVVAVKRPTSAEAAATLLNEAAALASVRHENLARYVGLECIDDEWHLVMEYVDGVPLAELLDAGPWPCAAAVHVARSLLAGLAAMHERGIVHRDVSARNVMLANDGRVVLTDLGLATTSAEELGTLAGTLRYMAPEQAARQRLDGRADQHAVGILLWEMLAGRRYAADADDHALMARKLKPRPVTPVWSIRPEVPSAVDAAVLRMMEHSPDQRFPNTEAARAALPDPGDLGAADLAAAVRAHQGGGALLPLALSATTSVPPRRSRRIALAMACLAFGALGAIGLLGLPVSAPAPLHLQPVRHVPVVDEPLECPTQVTETQASVTHQQAERTLTATAGDELHKASPRRKQRPRTPRREQTRTRAGEPYLISGTSYPEQP
ncbi:serine/threonine-protein kinase [Haliangium sp.]|uniref:serine/threonine-protein kinase n=1 Tax=Haliangium sp. TaxID=2663208 RepID=UPI003D14E96D